ncbi:MAG: hypothetical protein A2054_02560 [Deltaproteobacteria bacterium GWA2_55_10]|nr:MAG: hypothetical protein A2054_02560 [Deltaproteobacteria bacterium GWA2_55_10]
MTNEIPIELLNDAFNVFRDASKKLEDQYAVLETRVEELNSELAEKNRAIERSRRLAAMGEMAARIAHEIRNPLGSMSIFATLLERELAEDKRKKLAEQISKGIKTLDNLLSNMLLFANSPEARLKSMDIKEIIDDSILLTKGREKKGVEISVAHSGETVITADPDLLRQLFLNLMINALDAVEDNGRVEVTTNVVERDGSDYMEIKVSDNGRGIAARELDRIFDPFFTTKERGTGLGLAIVTSVVDAHAGWIKAESALEEGTAFTIGIPVKREFRI